MNPAMSWHGTKGFPGGREIKLDPGLKPSAAIYASLNLLSSASMTRRRLPGDPPPPRPVPRASPANRGTGSQPPRSRNRHRRATTPPIRCSRPRSHTGPPESVASNLRLEVSPASCYRGDYFFIFYAPPTAASHHLVRRASRGVCSNAPRRYSQPPAPDRASIAANGSSRLFPSETRLPVINRATRGTCDFGPPPASGLRGTG